MKVSNSNNKKSLMTGFLIEISLWGLSSFFIGEQMLSNGNVD